MSRFPITINLAVHNGEQYIRQCLDSVLGQNYPHELTEINVLDNHSSDKTVEVTESWKQETGNRKPYPSFSLIKSEKNWGMWPGQEKLLKHSNGKYIIALSVDVILDKNFIKNSVGVMEKDSTIGALQGKIYKYGLSDVPNSKFAYSAEATSAAKAGQIPNSKIIDTLGFQIFRSRRIVNIGHGETDHGQYDFQKIPDSKFQIPDSSSEIFAVEGAVPVFHRQALEDCRLKSQAEKAENFRGSTSDPSLRLNLKEGNLKEGSIIDPDFFWYGDDLDLAWRMRLFGWKQVYAPNVIAWHDRKTTKALADGWREFIKIRKTVPMFKRRLDWRNTTLTIIKNGFAANILRDLPYILWRQVRLWAYFLLFEPAMILEIFKVAKLLPRMLKRRSEIMQKAKISAKDFRQWIN